jgi:hypothetical protein
VLLFLVPKRREKGQFYFAIVTMRNSVICSFLFLWTLLASTSSVFAAPVTPEQLQQVKETALQARELCFKEMYRDPNAYAQCIRNLRQKYEKQEFKSLGAEYFGFVGALSYMRVSQMGAESIATEFLKSFRVNQKRLGISDGALCGTVPGNCAIRNRQMLDMEKSPKQQLPLQVRCEGSVCSVTPVQKP